MSQDRQPQSIEIMTKSFKTIEDVTNDPKFLTMLDEVIGIEHKRIARSLANAQKAARDFPGQYPPKLKRSFYDVLNEKGYLTPDYISERFLEINKRSCLWSAPLREYVVKLCQEAIKLMVKSYSVKLTEGMVFATKNTSARGYIKLLHNDGIVVQRTLRDKEGHFTFKEEQWPYQATALLFESGKYYIPEPEKKKFEGFPEYYGPEKKETL